MKLPAPIVPGRSVDHRFVQAAFEQQGWDVPDDDQAKRFLALLEREDIVDATNAEASFPEQLQQAYAYILRTLGDLGALAPVHAAQLGAATPPSASRSGSTPRL